MFKKPDTDAENKSLFNLSSSHKARRRRQVRQ